MVIGKLWDGVNGKTSRMVDENGEPMVMYHGTPETFTVFDGTKSYRPNGFFVATYRGTAKAYAGEDGNIIGCFVNLRNPVQRDAQIKLPTEQIETPYVFDIGKYKAAIEHAGFKKRNLLKRMLRCSSSTVEK